jgi:hypothetical protein
MLKGRWSGVGLAAPPVTHNPSKVIAFLNDWWSEMAKFSQSACLSLVIGHLLFVSASNALRFSAMTNNK